MSYPKGSIASAITGSLPAPVVLRTSHAHASCWLQLHPRSKPRLTMLRQTNAPVAAAAWSSLRPSSAAPARATEHRRHPPPSGSTPHDHDRCVATWLQLHPRSKPRLTMLRQTNAPVAAAVWSSLRPSSAAPTRATEHRRQPPPSGSTPHDHDRCVATTKCQPCLLLVSDQPR